MTDLQDELFERLGKATWHGERYFSALCPFPHEGQLEQHPSLMVYPKDFYCTSCHKGGSLDYLLNAINGSFTPYKQHSRPLLPKWGSWEQRFGGDIESIARVAHEAVTSFASYDTYFKKRKIWQFFEQGMFGRLDGWVLFPVIDRDGAIVDIVVRNRTYKEAPKYVIYPYSDEATRPLYCPNWKRVLKEKYLVVCFGIVDSWAFEALEIPCVTGITGKSFNAELLRDFRVSIYVVPDKGEDRAAASLVNALGFRGYHMRLKYPKGCKDPDDIRRILGDEELLRLFRQGALV